MFKELKKRGHHPTPGVNVNRFTLNSPQQFVSNFNAGKIFHHPN
jgi:hypothetical protein